MTKEIALTWSAGRSGLLIGLMVGSFAGLAASAAGGEALDRARALLEAGRAREALPLIDAAIASEPTSAPAFLLRGQIKIELKDWAGSEADIQKGLDLDPMSADAHYLRGYRYAIDGNDRLAIQLYNRAIELAPGRPGFWYARGTAKERRNNFAGAREDYRQALLRSPDDADSRRELASVEQRLGLPPTTAGEILAAATAHAAAGGDRRSIDPPVEAMPGAAPTPWPREGSAASIPGIEPLPAAVSSAATSPVGAGLSAAALAADELPPDDPASPAAVGAPVADAAPPPGILTDEAVGNAASELLLTFARAVLYLGPSAEDPANLRAVCEGLGGDYFSLELTHDAASGDVEVAETTAVALGNDRAYAFEVARGYAAPVGGDAR